MPEAWGTVALRVKPDLHQQLLKCEGTVPAGMVSSLLDAAKSDLERKIGANDELIVFEGQALNSPSDIDLHFEAPAKDDHGYVVLEVSGLEWAGLAYLLCDGDQDLEIYAEISDEYGTHYHFARAVNGESQKFWYEEDSDEFDQEDFDELAYEAELEERINRWRKLIPAGLQGEFE